MFLKALKTITSTGKSAKDEYCGTVIIKRFKRQGYAATAGAKLLFIRSVILQHSRGCSRLGW
jgi:hypothetical protein